MMSTQMDNWRHVGFQSCESQTCETLAFSRGTPSSFLYATPFFGKFSLSHPPFPPPILRLHSDGCRLVGMLILDALSWKRSLWESSWPSTLHPPPLRPSSETHTTGLCSVLSFIICSIAHRVHYVCWGARVSAPRAKACATVWGLRGITEYTGGLKVCALFGIHHFMERPEYNWNQAASRISLVQRMM